MTVENIFAYENITYSTGASPAIMQKKDEFRSYRNNEKTTISQQHMRRTGPITFPRLRIPNPTTLRAVPGFAVLRSSAMGPSRLICCLPMSTVNPPRKSNTMRFDDEHAYDQRINDTQTIHEHIIPEHRYRKIVLELSKKHGNINGAYWLIDLICALNPGEFNEQRKIALKQLTQKIYVSYDDVPTNKQLCAIMKATGISPSQIAHNLGISRNTVYYFLDRDQELPTRCMLTYGEYNLMLDFID
jgi:hypothetical protein